MVATTDQKARLLDLVTGVLELTRDGKRSVEEVAAVFQIIKDDPKFARRLLSLNGRPTFLRDMAKEGWTLVEDGEGDPISANQLELVSFLKRGESYVNGKEMKKRAEKKNAALGQRQAEYLRENQEEIPSEWRNHYLTFPGTVWRAPGGRLRVPYLGWDGDGWSLDFRWLGSGWFSLDRLVRPSK